MSFYAPNLDSYMDEKKPMTNADRIRAMTDEELAELLADETHRIAKPVFDYFGYGIEKQIVYARRLDWLQQPEEGADHE
jgi:hypothetical protein